MAFQRFCLHQWKISINFATILISILQENEEVDCPLFIVCNSVLDGELRKHKAYRLFSEY